MSIFKDGMYLQIVLALTRSYSSKSEYPVSDLRIHVHSQMNAQTISLYAMSVTPESNSALHNQLDCNDEDRRYWWPLSRQVSWKRSMPNNFNDENITY